MVKFVSNIVGELGDSDSADITYDAKTSKRIYDANYNILKNKSKELVSEAKARGLKVDDKGEFSENGTWTWGNFLPSYNGAEYN